MIFIEATRNANTHAILRIPYINRIYICGQGEVRRVVSCGPNPEYPSIRVDQTDVVGWKLPCRDFRDLRTLLRNFWRLLIAILGPRSHSNDGPVDLVERQHWLLQHSPNEKELLYATVLGAGHPDYDS